MRRMPPSSSRRSAASLKYAIASPKTETSRTEGAVSRRAVVMRYPFPISPPEPLGLYVESEVHDVGLVHYVLPALAAEAPRGAQRLHGLVLHVILVRDDLGPDEAPLDVAVNRARRLGSLRPLANRPGTSFLFARGEERHQAEPLDAQPPTKLGRLGFREPGPLGFDLAAEHDGPPALGERDLLDGPHPLGALTHLLLVHVGNIKDGLGGQQERIGRDLRLERVRCEAARRARLLQRCGKPLR